MATLTPSCRFLPAIGLGLLLTACGGGGSSDSSGAPPSGGTSTATVSGTAAVGAAITGATLTATCQDGSGFTVSPVTTNTNGKWSGKVESDQLPCLLELKNGTPNIELNSMVFAAGTANISPLTHLALVMTKADVDFNWTDNTANWPTKTQLDASATTLLQALKDKGYADASLSGSPFTTAFDANGTGWDALLDSIRELVEDLAGSINGYGELAQLLADGNIDSLPEYEAPTDPGEPSDTEYALAPADFSAVSSQPAPQDFFDLMKSQSWPVAIILVPDTHPEWYGEGSLTIGGNPTLTPGSYPGTVEISGTWTMELKGADGSTISSLSSDEATDQSIIYRYIKPFNGDTTNGEIHITKEESIEGKLKVYASAHGRIWGQTGLGGGQAVEFRNDIVAYSDESDSVPAIFDELAGTWSAEVTDSCVEPTQQATNTVTITAGGDIILNGPVAGTISGICVEPELPKTLHWGGSNDILVPHNPATGGGPANAAYLMRIDTVNTGVDGGEVNIYLDDAMNIVEINTRSPKLKMKNPVKQ